MTYSEAIKLILTDKPLILSDCISASKEAMYAVAEMFFLFFLLILRIILIILFPITAYFVQRHRNKHKDPKKIITKRNENFTENENSDSEF